MESNAARLRWDRGTESQGSSWDRPECTSTDALTESDPLTVARLVAHYTASDVNIKRDKETLAPLKGFTHQPIEVADDEQPRDIAKERESEGS